MDDEEDAVGIICIGAPVIDHRGDCAGAISVTRIKGDFGDEEIDRIGGTEVECAGKLWRLLGSRI